ncbi:UMTA [Colletotrichum higginsianum]|uniref:UMTA n=1 Tax=Colletotrichum higginsianum (strain IMI 349063) TaxID=759273 RepID=H1VM99_COLHI|nr:UMTA [Colletotrichum higginsianum]
MDLSPTSPSTSPPNVTFEVDDLEKNWLYSRPLEYIHSRSMISSVNDWKVYLQKCYSHFTPGGWIELQELDLFPRSDDGTVKPEHPLIKRVLKCLQVATQPLGEDPKYKELGVLNGQNIADGLEGFCMESLTLAHGWTSEEVNVFLVDVRNNIKDRSVHAYWPL